MSVHVSAYVWEHSQHGGTALLLMLAIADIAHKNGVAFPSVATLARFIRMSERNTQRVIAALEKSGELEIKRNGGPHGTHLYRVRMNLTLPLFDGGDNLSPDKMTGDVRVQKGVTKQASRGDAAVAPEPKEPKEEQQKGSAATRRSRLPVGFKASEAVQKWYAEKDFPKGLLPLHLETFIRKVEANGSKYVDWDKALMNAVADDWGDVRRTWSRLNGGGREMATHPASDWWKSSEGILAHGKKLGVGVPDAKEAGWIIGYTAKVWLAAGPGQWVNDRDTTVYGIYQRLLEKAHA